MAAEGFELYTRPGVITVTLKRMRRKITNETWEQIKTGYAAGINNQRVSRKRKVGSGPAVDFA